jgi:hypothetical protein
MKIQFPKSGFVATACAVCLLWVSTPASTWAQEPDTSSPSLGDLARQTRAQHEAAENTSSKAQELVDEMQQEQEAVENAPAGFKNYDAGDYRLFVPFPYTLEGRDNGGAVLQGSRIGLTNTEVMAGTPIPIPPTIDDVHLPAFVQDVARKYSQGSRCIPVAGTTHKTFECTLGEARLLDHQVWGNMEVIVASNRLFPVMCASPDNLRPCQTWDSHGYSTCENPYKNIYSAWSDPRNTQRAVQARNSDAQTTAQVCEKVIFPSIQLKEDIVVHPASMSENKTSAKAPAVAQASPPIGADSQSPSLADLARQTRQAPHGTAQATLDSTEAKGNAPPGYQTFTFQYCYNPQQCEDASIAIPEKAEVVSRINGQYIFKTTLDGDPLQLYAGPADVNAPYRSLTDPDYMRMRDLANPNGWSREKPDAVSTQQVTLEGRAGVATRFRYQREEKRWWIGERVLLPNWNPQFLLACTAPEEHFADAEAVCSALVKSLHLP